MNGTVRRMMVTLCSWLCVLYLIELFSELPKNLFLAQLHSLTCVFFCMWFSFHFTGSHLATCHLKLKKPTLPHNFTATRVIGRKKGKWGPSIGKLMTKGRSVWHLVATFAELCGWRHCRRGVLWYIKRKPCADIAAGKCNKVGNYLAVVASESF